MVSRGVEAGGEGSVVWAEDVVKEEAVTLSSLNEDQGEARRGEWGRSCRSSVHWSGGDKHRGLALPSSLPALFPPSSSSSSSSSSSQTRSSLLPRPFLLVYKSFVPLLPSCSFLPSSWCPRNGGGPDQYKAHSRRPAAAPKFLARRGKAHGRVTWPTVRFQIPQTGGGGSGGGGAPCSPGALVSPNIPSLQAIVPRGRPFAPTPPAPPHRRLPRAALRSCARPNERFLQCMASEGLYFLWSPFVCDVVVVAAVVVLVVVVW
ncbi:hypothetical protein E2C01_049691 [Portunus trituberculatus]|uniref:Uncharacterized protein n=1 Tax=Portunus trituberculatus TaxID=210409 RepID=A0A5B7GEI3_PORTR|nr:hypothetical protein [Portunus trituberculatus]